MLLLDGRHSLIEGRVAALGDGRRDLAVVVVPVPRIPPLRLATDKAVEGENIAVAGFPSIQFRLAESGLGLSPSMHVGTVNAIVGQGFYIEYDAQTDHGNSGGPLYDVGTARVYGVVTYGIQSTSSGAVQNNLAIAAPYARDVIAEALQSPNKIASRQIDSTPSSGTSRGPSEAASAGATVSPADTVREFYELLNSRRYAEAYALLSPDFRRDMTYARWKAGYATTVRSAASVENSDDPSNVPTRLVATDDKGGVLVTTEYVGRWSLIADGRGGWLLDAGRLRRVSTY